LTNSFLTIFILFYSHKELGEFSVNDFNIFPSYLITNIQFVEDTTRNLLKVANDASCYSTSENIIGKVSSAASCYLASSEASSGNCVTEFSNAHWFGDSQ